MKFSYAHLLQMIGHCRIRTNPWLSATIACHRDAAPSKRCMNPRAERLRECLLRGETLREMPRLVARSLKSNALLGRQDTLNESLSEALQRLLDALDRTDIGPDS